MEEEVFQCGEMEYYMIKQSTNIKNDNEKRLASRWQQNGTDHHKMVW